MTSRLPASVRTLLTEAIDYAGLFPPAALRTPDAVAEYQRHRAEPDRWALGRFVVPAARIEEFVTAALAAGLLPAPADDPVTLAVLATGDLPAGLEAVARLQVRAPALGVVVAAIETRAAQPAEARAAARLIPRDYEGWVEIPLGPPAGPMIEAVLGGGGRPKIRVGGVSPELFPSAEDIVEFLAEAVRRETAFKATAGLHHPLRGVYPYTYLPESASGPMFGYLNLLVATALLMEHQPADEARRALLDEDPEAFAFAEAGLTWRGRRLDLAALARLRQTGLRSIGSCSFRDPMRELQPLLPT